MMNRWLLVSIGLVGAALLCVLGIGLTRSLYTVTAPSPKVVVAPTSVAMPTPGAIGSTGRLRSTGSDGYVVLWVDELGLSAFERAFENRDDRGISSVLDVFETVQVAGGTPVTVTARNASVIQVEVASGPYAGRRGWIRPILLVP